MNTLIQKFLALFSTAQYEQAESPDTHLPHGGMPLASAVYLSEFAQRLGLEVDDLSPAEQAELKARLDKSMDFREENYSVLYHEVYQLGHGYSLADAGRVSAQITSITEDPAARAYLDYRENAVAAEALMAAGSLLEQEGHANAAARLFKLADARRHRSSALNFGEADKLGTDREQEEIADEVNADAPADASESPEQPDHEPASGLSGLMYGPIEATKPVK